jgi:hypothetical protein
MTIQNAAGRSGVSARRCFCLLSVLCFLSIAFFPASRSAGRESLRDGPKTHKSNPFLPATVANSRWPFIRNSTFDDHSPEIHIADSWPDEGPPVLWTRELGQGYSAFVAKGERVFTQAQTLGGQVVLVDGHIYGFDIFDAQSKVQRPSRGKFRCINFLTGETTWEIGTGRPRRMNSTRPADAEPEIGQSGIVVADSKLIILNELGELILARVNPERYEELTRTSVLSGELT